MGKLNFQRVHNILWWWWKWVIFFIYGVRILSTLYYAYNTDLHTRTSALYLYLCQLWWYGLENFFLNFHSNLNSHTHKKVNIENIFFIKKNNTKTFLKFFFLHFLSIMVDVARFRSRYTIIYIRRYIFTIEETLVDFNMYRDFCKKEKRKQKKIFLKLKSKYGLNFIFFSVNIIMQMSQSFNTISWYEGGRFI